MHRSSEIRSQLAKLIGCIESIRQRPEMYIGSLDVTAMVHFLSGWQTAIGMFIEADQGLFIREQVVKGHGWEWSARNPSEEMVSRGLSSREVIEELLAIEVEVLQQVAWSMA